MAFCSKCGTEVPENVKFCPGCGAPASEEARAQAQAKAEAEAKAKAEAQAKAQAQQAQAAGAAAGAGDASDKINSAITKLTDTKDTTSEYDPEDIQKNKIYALFSYVGILFLIPLLAAKDSKFARFHVNQGIVLFGVNVIYSVISAIIGFILGIIGAILDSTVGSLLVGLVSTLFGLIGLVPLALMVFGIVMAVTGKAKELPVIGKIRIIK